MLTEVCPGHDIFVTVLQKEFGPSSIVAVHSVGTISFPPNKIVKEIKDDIDAEAISSALAVAGDAEAEVEICTKDGHLEDSTLVSEVTEVKVTTTPNCIGCSGLKKEVSYLKEKVASLEQDASVLKERSDQSAKDVAALMKTNDLFESSIKCSRDRAILRQVAVNIEYELKMLVIYNLMPPEKSNKFFYDDREDDVVNVMEVVGAPIKIFTKYVTQDFPGFMASYTNAVGRKCDPELSLSGFNILINGLKVMKDGFNGEAHPTCTLDGTEVNLLYCQDLLKQQAIDLNTLTTDMSKSIENSMIDLGEIRKQKGEKRFLYN